MKVLSIKKVESKSRLIPYKREISFELENKDKIEKNDPEVETGSKRE